MVSKKETVLIRRWVAIYFPVRRTYTRTSKIVPHALANAPRFLGDCTRTRTFYYFFFIYQLFLLTCNYFFFLSKNFQFFLKRNHSLSINCIFEEENLGINYKSTILLIITQKDFQMCTK
jgi:hypothetical protein